MPQSNGKIYIEGVYGISLDDIGKCLGLSSRDLGTLCQGMDDYDDTANTYTGKIAIWSKAKPTYFQGYISGSTHLQDRPSQQQGEAFGNRTNPYDPQSDRANNPFHLTHSIEIPSGKKLYDYSLSTTSDWGHMDLNTGFLGALMRDGEELATPLHGIRWKFQAPMGNAQVVGGATTPFRALDFNNYIDYAVCPLPTVVGDTIGVYADHFTGNIIDGQPEMERDDFLRVYVHAIMPQYLPIGNITYDDVNNDIIGKAMFFQKVISPSGNPKAKLYYERSGSEPYFVYNLSNDTSVNSSKTYYSVVGMGNMYICAVLYHVTQAGKGGSYSIDTGSDFKKIFWASASSQFGDVTATENRRRILFKFPKTDAAFSDLGREGNFLINGNGYDDTNGWRKWMMKLFLCTHPINTNCLPGEELDEDGEIIKDPTKTGPDSTGALHPGTYDLVRATDGAFNVSFVDSRDAIPYIRAAWVGITAHGTNPTYGVHVVVFNYSNLIHTYTEAAIAFYNHSTKEQIGEDIDKRTGGTFVSNPLTASDITFNDNIGTSVSVDIVIVLNNDNTGEFHAAAYEAVTDKGYSAVRYYETIEAFNAVYNVTVAE